MAALNILIIGASIAGPAFASFLCLSDVKANITILERAPKVRPEGQNVDLRSVGLQCINILGLEKRVRANLTGEEGVKWVNAENKPLAVIPASKFGEAQGPTAELEILRGTLAKLVVQRCEELAVLKGENSAQKVNFIYDDYIDSLEQHGDGVRVTLAKSKVIRHFDIVVGADGLQSRTRRQAFGAEGEVDRLHSLHVYGGFFSMPKISSDDRYRHWYLGLGRRGIVTRPSDRPDRTTVFMHVKSEEPRYRQLAKGPLGVQAQKAMMKDTFTGIGWQEDRILKEMEAADDFYYDMIGQVKMDCWSRGRVVLLGDAAHCASPFSGMGTSLALAGAYNLAGALAQNPNDIEAAFQQYEETQRPLVTPAQKLSPMLGFIFKPDSAFQVWLWYCFVAFVSYSSLILRPLFYFAGPGSNVPKLHEYDEIRTAPEIS